MYSYEYRGYKLTFSDDETSVVIERDGEELETLTDQPGRVEWEGDTASEVEGTTARVAAIHWVNKDIKRRQSPKD